MWTPDKGKVREEVRKREAVLLCGRSLHFSGMDDWDKSVCVCPPSIQCNSVFVCIRRNYRVVSVCCLPPPI